MIWYLLLFCYHLGWSFRISVWPISVPLRRGHPELVHPRASVPCHRQARPPPARPIRHRSPSDRRQLCAPHWLLHWLPVVIRAPPVHNFQHPRPSRQACRHRHLPRRCCWFLSRAAHPLLCRARLQLSELRVLQLHSADRQVLQEHGGEDRTCRSPKKMRSTVLDAVASSPTTTTLPLRLIRFLIVSRTNQQWQSLGELYSSVKSYSRLVQ